MKLLIVVALIATAQAQILGGGGFGDLIGIIGGLFGGGGGDSGTPAPTTTPGDNSVDQIHDWRVEDHQTATSHLLLFINDNPNRKYCYAVVVDKSWESLLTHEDDLIRISDEIYAIITDPNHTEHPMHPGDFANDYGDFEAAKECQGHDTYYLDYEPSWLSTRR